MKAILIKTLCLMLILDLSLGATTVRAEEGTKRSVTSPAELLKQVQEESESIFGKNGCAKIDEKGAITLTNRITSAAIQGEGAEKHTIDCAERIKAHIPRAKMAMTLVSEYRNQNQKAAKSTDCANCGVPTQALVDDAIPPGGMCSKKEKLALKKQRETNPQCSMGCELRGSLKKTVGSLGGLLSPDASCNIDKGGTGYFGCLSDFVMSLFTSLGSMVKTAWEGVRAASRWVSGLFGFNKAGERGATATAGVFANMSDAEIAAAQKNPARANQTLLGKVGGALNWIMENVVGLDTPTYSEMWGCAKCGERVGVICKLAGVLGKDIIKNAILIWIGGKAIGGIAKLGKAALGGLKAGGNLVGKGVMNTAAGRVMVKWGANQTAALSSKSALAFESFLNTGAGKASSTMAKLGAKGVVAALKGAATGMEKLDNAMMFFPKLFVRGGKTVAAEIKAISNRADIFKSTPVLTADEASEAGLKTLADTSPGAPMEVEVPNVLTPEMKNAKAVLEKKAPKDAKGLTNDIENAVEHGFETAGPKGVKVGHGANASYLEVENPANVNRVFTYNEGRNALVRMQDGSTLILAEGKVIQKIPAKNAKEVNNFLGAEQGKADDLALQQMKRNAEDNGIKVQEPNSSSKDPQTEFKVNSGPECGNQNILFYAGKAI